LEIQRALDINYKILEIYEVHHFEKFATGLFAKYIDRLLKYKQEASGWGDIKEEDKDAFIEKYLQKEGIHLDKAKIEYNEGLRTTVKLCLNALWGKYGQKPNLMRTKTVRTVDELDEILEDDTIKVIGLPLVVSENCIRVNFKSKDDFIEDSQTSNIYIAIFTTSQARLKLYNELILPLGDKILYCDTDSAFFVWDDISPFPFEVGEFLGMPKNELRDGLFITEFVSGGPKNYGYRLCNNETKLKVKGFTLNYMNSQKITLKTMIDILQSAGKQSIELPDQFTMKKNKKNYSIQSSYITKTYNFEFNKSIIEWETQTENCLKTRPFG
jgi:hypothetical protein